MQPLTDPSPHERTDVVIIGAGPTGLILAHELLRRGIRCRMIEKRANPSGSTRAFTLHARTMEMFDHMGIAARIDELREVCPGNRFHFRELAGENHPMPVLDFTRLPGTRYNFYGKVNQSDLDQALRESLAAKYSFYPEFGVEYVGSVTSEEGIDVRVRRLASEGAEETIAASWIVGADGSNSSVRASLGSGFAQTEGNTMTMSMVDVCLHGFNGDRSWVNYYVSEKGFALVTGLPGGKFRLYLAGEMEDLLKDAPPQEAFQKSLDYFETGAKIVSMDWSSSWIIRKIVGETYCLGRVILCGDATHVHSPAGGQGMNACMQDAFNLGWKLALLVQGKTSAAILDTYLNERRPIAEQVTEGADRMHRILFDAATPVNERFSLTQNPEWHDETILRISGLSHNYRYVDGAVFGLELSDGAVQPGDRAPDCVFSAEVPRKRLYDVTRHAGFTLLVVPDASPDAAVAARELSQEMARTYGSYVKTVAIGSAPIDGFDFDHTVLDSFQALHTAYGAVEGGQLILIRPDLYVGFRGSLSSANELHRYLRKWLPSATAR